MIAAPLKVESKVGSKAEVSINVDLLLKREFVLYMCAYMLACVLITYTMYNTCLYRCVPINYLCIPITCSQYVLCLMRK